MSRLLTFKNENPTETEKELYLYAGFYVIEDHGGINEDLRHIKYAVCYTDESMRKEFPKEISILQENVNYKDTISFKSDCEIIKITGFIDTKLLNLITKRAEELGWHME